ncbi:MarR family winged helix-turn-helix transcriptional regulator [Allofournierella sp.]|uniref:MarR family winged helix-turn-helix transcriptional regulator n=1 Tax=Allofournierella sp. TaxID=1940256 RepID=UPI003AF09EE0
MHKDQETRLELVRALIQEKRKTTLAYSQYLAKNREYAPGEQLYMREVHFVIAVGPGEGHTMSELAEKLDVTQGAVSQLAARMEKKGFVQRRKAAGDRRQTVATLTAKGEALYREHTLYDRARYQEISEMLGRFSERELRRLWEYENLMGAAFTKENRRNVT